MRGAPRGQRGEENAVGREAPAARGAAAGHAAEQLQDLEPEQRHERLLAGIGQVGVPALARGAEHAVVVDADDAADPDAFAPLQLGEGAVQVGAGDADLGEQGPGLGAVDRVEPIARLLEQAVHVGAPALQPAAGDDPVIRYTVLLPLAPLWFGPTSRVRVASTVSPSFFLSAPEMAPRMVCFCQPVAAAICSTVAPSGRLSMSIMSACLVPVRSVGFSAGAALPGLAAFALAFALRLAGVAATSGLTAGAGGPTAGPGAARGGG